MATSNLPLDTSVSDKNSQESRMALEAFLQQQDAESPLTQYLQVLVRQKWIVLAIIVACVLAAAFVNAMTTKLYRASGSMEIAREAARVVNGDGTTGKAAGGGAAAMEFYQTQYGLLRSRALAEATVTSLRLADNPTFLYGYNGGKAPANGLKGDRRARELRAAQLVQGHLTVEPTRGSSLVLVSFDSPDPALSASVVNSLAKNYISANLNRRFQASAYARSYLQQKLEEMRVKLEASERALVAYAGKEKIINFESGSVDKEGDPAPGVSVVSTDLRALNDALNAAKIDRAQAEARYQQAQRSGGLTAAESLSDTTINNLRNSRAQLQAEYQKLSAQFRTDYPQMVALRQQIAELDKQIGGQGGVVLASLRSAYQAAVQRQGELQKQVDGLKSGVLDLRERSVEYGTLQRDTDTNRAQYNALLQQYKEIDIAAGVGSNNVSVVDAALSGGLVQPRSTMNLLLGLLIGVLIGGAAAFILEQLDESIIAPHDLERKLGVPLLGSVPRVPDSEVSIDLLEDSKTPLAEAYLSLQTALRLTTSKGAPNVLFVTSSRPSEGKSTTAMAVARNFAALGKRTILIDADLRNPSVHKMLGFANSAGLTNMLAGATDLPTYVRKGPVDLLSVMSSGPIPPNPAELLAGPNLSTLFDRLLKEGYEHVVVDGPPVLGLADAPLIASYAQATMFVVAAKNTHTRTARVSLRRLADVHANILGAVLTKFDAKRVGYDYGYNYDYGDKRIGFMKRVTG